MDVRESPKRGETTKWCKKEWKRRKGREERVGTRAREEEEWRNERNNDPGGMGR